MDIGMIALSIASVSGVGLVIGLLLGVVGKKFAVETDDRVVAVRDHLAGSNCGGCGYAGCDACAEAIVRGDAKVNACLPAGADNIRAIGEIMGITVNEEERLVSFVRCAGTCDKTKMKSNYYGIKDCREAVVMPGGTPKECSYGCLGYGSCVKACLFDAIHIVDGIAKTDPEKCTACGGCVRACPKGLVTLVPYSATQIVRCSSKDKGKVVREACSAGCIGCGICVKNCPANAITLKDNLAVIDQDKCTRCGTCASKCPAKVITIGQK